MNIVGDLSQSIASKVYGFHVGLALGSIRRALRLLRHPAARASDAKLLAALALVGWAVLHVGRCNMTIEEFRGAMERINAGRS